jgi:hypothetical protein
MSLDSYSQDFLHGTSGVVIEVSMYLRSHFFFVFSPLFLVICKERKEKKNKNILETHQSSDKDITSIIKKYLDKTNTTTPKKVTNGERSGPHELSKSVRAHLFLGCLCGPLRLPLMTSLGVIRFALSISFQRYQWCSHRNLDVLLSLFIYFFVSHLSHLSFLNLIFGDIII